MHDANDAELPDVWPGHSFLNFALYVSPEIVLAVAEGA